MDCWLNCSLCEGGQPVGEGGQWAPTRTAAERSARGGPLTPVREKLPPQLAEQRQSSGRRRSRVGPRTTCQRSEAQPAKQRVFEPPRGRRRDDPQQDKRPPQNLPEAHGHLTQRRIGWRPGWRFEHRVCHRSPTDDEVLQPLTAAAHPQPMSAYAPVHRIAARPAQPVRLKPPARVRLNNRLRERAHVGKLGLYCAPTNGSLQGGRRPRRPRHPLHLAHLQRAAHKGL